MKNKIINYIKIFILFISVFLFTGVSFAWLSRTFNPKESSVTLEASETPPLEFAMWTFQTKKEADPDANMTAIANASDNTGSWVLAVNSSGTKDEYGDYSIEMKSAFGTAGSGTVNSANYSFDVRNLQMGTINNLHKERNDNIVYMRFHISAANLVSDNGRSIMFDPETKGSVLKFNVSQPYNDYLHIFDKSGKQFNSSYLVSLNKIDNLVILDEIKRLNREDQFFKFAYCIYTGDAAPAPGTQSFADNIEKQLVPIDVNSSAVGLKGSVLKTDIDAADYYLYVKVSPNLSTYGKATKYMYAYIPCTMLFDWKFEIEVQ